MNSLGSKQYPVSKERGLAKSALVRDAGWSDFETFTKQRGSHSPKKNVRSTEFRVAGWKNTYETALSPVSTKSLEIFVRSVKCTALYFRDSHPKREWMQNTKLAARWANNNLYLIVRVKASGLKEQKERKEPWLQFKDTFLSLVLHSQSITTSSWSDIRNLCKIIFHFFVAIITCTSSYLDFLT